MLNTVCYWLVVVGALNYGLMAFGYNFLEKLPANIGSIVSIAIAVAALWTIFANLKKQLFETMFLFKSSALSRAFI